MTAAVGFFVGTGARDEPRSLMGVSHFLEHMLFKGSATRNAEQVNRDFDAIGAKHNAFTSLEVTAYHASCLPEHLGRATELVADLFRPSLRESDVDEERGVILEEIAMYDDDPHSVLYESTMESYFGDVPLGHRVLGVPETIRPMLASDLRSYFTTHYAASNGVIAAAGKLDFEKLVAHVERETADWPHTAPSRDATPVPSLQGRLSLTSKKARRGYLLMAWPAPAQDDDTRRAASIAAFILGGSDNSRLDWALVDKGIAENVSCGVMPMDGTGVALADATCDPARLPEVESLIRDEANRLRDTLSEGELLRAKARVNTAAVFAGERPSGRMKRMGRHVAALGTYASLDEEVAKIDALTLQDLRDVLNHWPMQPCCVGTMVPQESV